MEQAKGQLDLLALHDFVVKVAVFMKAVDASVKLDDDIAELFSQYAGALSEQGSLVTAAKYAKYVLAHVAISHYLESRTLSHP